MRLGRDWIWLTLLFGGAAYCAFSWPAAAAERPGLRAVLDAIRFVESSGRANPPDGDGGRAIGPYQIWKIYWTDAVKQEPKLGHGTYQDCRRLDYAERVITAYMQRYAPDAWERVEAETIARIHNGGPKGYQKAATLPYWRKVEAALQRGASVRADG